MIRLVIAFSFVALAFGGTIPDVISSSSWQGRIVGGQTATPGQFSYQVSLRRIGATHFCGGFIINSRWIGTAAHCTFRRTSDEIIAVVGAQNRATGGITHPISQVINHPNFSLLTITNDISVVQTTNEIVETATVRRIPLGSAFVTSGRAVTSGWGQIANPGPSAEELQFITVDVITNESCRSRLSAIQAARIIESTICTTSPVGVGTCGGDSGGPLTQRGAVIGAVSWGVPCALGSPDMFARISSQRSWIESVIAV